jgi:uncharacterized coiled-coil protein SlyX
LKKKTPIEKVKVGSPIKKAKMSAPDRAKQMIEELQQEVSFRDKIIRKLELRILEKEEEILQLRSDLDKVTPYLKHQNPY